MAKFRTRIEGSVELEISDRVIAAVDDSWRAQFYKLYTPQEIANHIAYNIATNHCSLTEIDGFANLDDNDVKVLDLEWEVEDC